MHKAPTTPESVPYGTPEMAYAIMQLLEDPVQAQWKFLIMAGHQEGCMAFGKDLQQAFEILTNLSKNN
jgi:altronate dehydratase